MMTKTSPSKSDNHEAIELYNSIRDSVNKVDRDLSIIRNDLRDLLHIRYVHKFVGFQTRKEMLNSIFKGKKNAYVLYDMANQAYVEYVIGDRKHDWKQSSLLDLYHHADEEDWRKIADLAEEQVGENRLTAKIVNAVIDSFYGRDGIELEDYNNSKNTQKSGDKPRHVSKEDDKKQLDDFDNNETSKAKKSASCAARSSNDAEKSNKAVRQDSSDSSKSERIIAKQLQKLSNLTLKEKKRVLDMLYPADSAGQIALDIIVHATDDQYDEVLKKLLDELDE